MLKVSKVCTGKALITVCEIVRNILDTRQEYTMLDKTLDVTCCTECIVLHCALKNTVLDYINTACSSKVYVCIYSTLNAWCCIVPLRTPC